MNHDYFDHAVSPSRPPEESDAPLSDETRQDDVVSLCDPAPESSGTAPSLKAAGQELLKYGLVENDAKPNLYRTLQQERVSVARILEPLDLALALDEVRGIAFLKLPQSASGHADSADDAWQHPLVRRQRLTNEQSLLVAILRQAYIAYEQTHGLGADGARVDFDELQAQFDLYLGDTGSESRNSERLSRIVTQLHAHGIVNEPDKENQVRIRPIIVHLANPENLQLLLHHFQQTAAQYPAPETAPTTDASDSEENG